MLGSMDLFVDELYLAGQRVPSGLYREIGTEREIMRTPVDTGCPTVPLDASHFLFALFRKEPFITESQQDTERRFLPPD